jgi:NTP pyrophosphatase (non-canonical NTP hydrolase)
MIIPKKIRQVSQAEKKTLIERGLKLNEEAGELAAEILRLEGKKGSNGKSRAEILYDLHLEAVDCMLMAMDILVYTKAPKRRIELIIESQLDKWKKGIKE